MLHTHRLTFDQYAADVIGGPPEDAADWQAVARALYAELNPSARVTLDYPEATTAAIIATMSGERIRRQH